MKKLTILFSIAVLTASILIVFKAKGTEAYVLTGHKWASGQMTYYVNASSSPIPQSDYITAVQAAANEWNTKSGANFKFIYAGTTTAPCSSDNDGKPMVCMAPTTSTSALAQNFVWWDGTGNLVDSNSLLYPNWKWFAGLTGCSGGYYVQNVETHELGHSLYLQHSTVSDATMYAGEPQCDTHKASIAADDIAGAQAIYGIAGAPTPQASISASPKTLSFSADINGSLPSPQSVLLTNTGTASSTWTTSTNQSFCHASPSSGTTAAGSSSPISVSMTMPSSTGAFSCIVSISDSKALNSPQQVSVSFNVTGTAPSDTTPPLVKINSPTDGSRVNGSVTISTTASDNVKISKVEFYIDNKLTATDTSYPYSYKWNVNKKVSSGTHTIMVKAYDPSGNTATASISVTH